MKKTSNTRGRAEGSDPWWCWKRKKWKRDASDGHIWDVGYAYSAQTFNVGVEWIYLTRGYDHGYKSSISYLTDTLRAEVRGLEMAVEQQETLDLQALQINALAMGETVPQMLPSVRSSKLTALEQELTAKQEELAEQEFKDEIFNVTSSLKQYKLEQGEKLQKGDKIVLGMEAQIEQIKAKHGRE